MPYTYPEAPSSVEELTKHNEQDKAPEGPMAPYCGRRYSIKEIREAKEEARGGYSLESEEEENLSLVRAWSIDILVRKQLRAKHSGALQEAFIELLSKVMPQIPWDNIENLVNLPELVLGKYPFLHTSLTAPPDSSTGQPMALELYGPIIWIEGVPPEEIQDWHYQNAYARLKNNEIPFITRPFVIELHFATWANIRMPFLGVPFYM